MNLPESHSWKHIFVYESGMIDPQPGYSNSGPGCQMYDNHRKALDFVLSSGWELSPHTPLDIHRILTKDIPFFERDSGKYSYQFGEARGGVFNNRFEREIYWIS